MKEWREKNLISGIFLFLVFILILNTIIRNLHQQDGYLDFYSFDDSGEIRWEHSFEDTAFSDMLTVDEDGTLYLVSTDGVLYAYGEEESKTDKDDSSGFFPGVFHIVLLLAIIVIVVISLIFVDIGKAKGEVSNEKIVD